jgi:hypothetical protein
MESLVWASLPVFVTAEGYGGCICVVPLTGICNTHRKGQPVAIPLIFPLFISAEMLHSILK